MRAAIRVSRSEESSVLLGADIEFDCLDEWKNQNFQLTACVLVFPHHGGLLGTSGRAEAAQFGFEIARMVSPKVVVFSNHRTKFGNPRDEVVTAIPKAAGGIRFVCTPLPERLRQDAEKNVLWSLHKPTRRNGVIEGSICLRACLKSGKGSFPLFRHALKFQKPGVRVCFGESP